MGAVCIEALDSDPFVGCEAWDALCRRIYRCKRQCLADRGTRCHDACLTDDGRAVWEGLQVGWGLVTTTAGAQFPSALLGRRQRMTLLSL